MTNKNLILAVSLLLASTMMACAQSGNLQNGIEIRTPGAQNGKEVMLDILTGPNWTIKSFPVSYIPQIAVWTADIGGGLVDILYVTKKFAKQSFFGFYDSSRTYRENALPYFLYVYRHSTGDNITNQTPLVDAVTSASPTGSFRLLTKISQGEGPLRVYLELNIAEDYNEFFTKSNAVVKFNGQPSVVYAADLDPAGSEKTYHLTLVGVGGLDGDSGILDSDTSRLTTAKELATSLTLTVR